jgi:hypothetical protein
LERFVPVDPEDDEASRQYGRIFEMMGHHMTTVFGQGSRCQALGILTTNWMLGQPINRIISARMKWNKRKGIEDDPAKTIRDTLQDIEQVARFQAPRYLACYSDIARELLNRTGQNDKAANIPDLTLSLEFGVRGPIQLELMALGLSRSSTLAISEAVESLLTSEEYQRVRFEPVIITEALGRIQPLEMRLPAIVLEEVTRLQEALKSVRAAGD